MPARISAASALLLAALALSTPSRADFRYPWYPLVDDPRTSTLDNVPACASEEVETKAISAFNETEARFWGGHLEMVKVEGLRERASIARGNDRLARRWCQGTAVFKDGVRHPIVMELLPNIETLGTRFALSYCIEALDREWADKPNCRVLNPKKF